MRGPGEAESPYPEPKLGGQRGERGKRLEGVHGLESIQSCKGVRRVVQVTRPDFLVRAGKYSLNARRGMEISKLRELKG